MNAPCLMEGGEGYQGPAQQAMVCSLQHHALRALVPPCLHSLSVIQFLEAPSVIRARVAASHMAAGHTHACIPGWAPSRLTRHTHLDGLVLRSAAGGGGGQGDEVRGPWLPSHQPWDGQRCVVVHEPLHACREMGAACCGKRVRPVRSVALTGRVAGWLARTFKIVGPAPTLQARLCLR